MNIDVSCDRTWVMHHDAHSNKCYIHIYTFLDAIVSQEMVYIQVTYLLTHFHTELKSSSRSGVPGLSDNPKMSRKVI